MITGVTERALRAVQAWTSPEAVVERLLVALTEAAERGATPEERSRARRLLDAVGQDGRGVLVGALGSALGAGLPGFSGRRARGLRWRAPNGLAGLARVVPSVHPNLRRPEEWGTTSGQRSSCGRSHP